MLGVEPVTRRNARLQAARSRRSSKRRVLTSCAAWTPGPTSVRGRVACRKRERARSPRGLVV